MHIDGMQTTMAASLVSARQAQTMTAVQMEIVKQVAEAQQAIADLLVRQGVGTQVDTHA